MTAPAPRLQLSQGLQGLFPQETEEWIGRAALAIAQLPDDAVAGLLVLPQGAQRAAIQGAVAEAEGRGAAGAAGTTTAAAGAQGLRTTAEILGLKLPSIRWRGGGSLSTGGGLKYLVPRNVQLLTCVPGQQELWEQEAISLQNDPAAEPWAAPLAAELTTFIVAEAGIAHALSQPLELLSKICNRTGGQLPKVGGWVAEASSNILQHAVAHHMAQHSENPVHNRLCQQATGSLRNSNASGWPARTDVVLVIDAEQQQLPQGQQQPPPQAQQQQPPQAQQLQLPQAQQQHEPPLNPLGVGPPVAIGEFKKPTILACPAGPNGWTPVDLVEGFRNKDPKAVRVVCQLFTHLVLYGLQFGFISCYFWTWVVHLSIDRMTMYISAPIAHNTESTRLKPAVTFMGAVHWVQTNGLRTYREPVVDIDIQQLMTLEELLRAPEPSQESHQSPPTDDHDSGSDYHPSTDSGNSSSGGDDRRSAKRRKGGDGASFSSQCINPHDSSGSQLQGGMRCNKHMQLSTAPDLLQLSGLICSGSSGLVMHGSFSGQPAVIKLYGPDSAGVAACCNEANVYSEM